MKKSKNLTFSIVDTIPEPGAYNSEVTFLTKGMNLTQ
jgi:hypothetical protein